MEDVEIATYRNGAIFRLCANDVSSIESTMCAISTDKVDFIHGVRGCLDMQNAVIDAIMF